MKNKSSRVSQSQPLDRALIILEALAGARRPLTVTELAAACELPLTTAHRMTQQLEERGMVKRALGSKKLIVGTRLARLGSAASEAAARTDRTHHLLMELAREVGESCQLGIRSGDEVMYVDTAQITPAIGLHFEQGRRSPLYCTSIGKLYLAEMDEAELEWWLDTTRRVAHTPNTVTDKAQFLEMARTIRQRQWAANNEELLLGVAGCAVPIRLSTGQLLACVGLYVPTARMPFERLTEYVPALNETARKIARTVEGMDMEAAQD